MRWATWCGVVLVGCSAPAVFSGGGTESAGVGTGGASATFADVATATATGTGGAGAMASTSTAGAGYCPPGTSCGTDKGLGVCL